MGEVGLYKLVPTFVHVGADELKTTKAFCVCVAWIQMCHHPLP